MGPGSLITKIDPESSGTRTGGAPVHTVWAPWYDYNVFFFVFSRDSWGLKPINTHYIGLILKKCWLRDYFPLFWGRLDCIFRGFNLLFGDCRLGSTNSAACNPPRGKMPISRWKFFVTE